MADRRKGKGPQIRAKRVTPVRRRAKAPRFHMARPTDKSRLRQLVERVLRPDLYHRLLTIGWLGFFTGISIAYLIFNLAFGAIYRLQPGSIANAGPSFLDYFFFSVQTMATIGYGDMHPATFYANLVVTVEVLLGMIGFAAATGLLFARFSRPTARVMFSRVAVIGPYEGATTLTFRAANERLNRIIEAQVHLVLARNEVTAEGDVVRRLHDLEAMRSRSPMFVLTWSVLHVIDAASPLNGETPETLAAHDGEIIVTLTGIDETLAQSIYTRHSYRAADVRWGHRFVDVITRGEDGIPLVDYTHFHDTEEPLSEPVARDGDLPGALT